MNARKSDVKIPMRVLVVSQYYLPETAHISSSVAQGLAEKHRVRVLTSFPNYPAGRIYQGYKQRWRHREQVGGVPVLRVPMYMNHSRSAARRMLNYVTFALSSATAIRYALGADVIYVYATQMTAAFGPWLWRLFGGAPYVLHVQDLWPDSITGSSMVKGGRAAGVVEVLLRPWLNSVYKRASAVIGIAPKMVNSLAGRGVANDKLHLVYNWAREGLRTDSRYESANGRCVVLFAGNVGDMQDLEVAVRAAHAEVSSGVELRIVGSGVALPRVRELARELGATNVEFVDRVPPERMTSLYSEADYSLVTLKALPAFRGTIPSKVQASLAAGLPLISTVHGDVEDLVRQRQVGFAAAPEDAEALATAFRVAAAQSQPERAAMVERARRVYRDLFSADAALTSIEKVLCRAAGEAELGEGDECQ